MALEGTIKDFGLPDIFQLIGLQKKTGVLRLNNESDEVVIAFKDGMLVSADSKNKRLEERLGTRLVRSGVITEERSRQAAIVAAQSVAGVQKVHDHLCWVDTMSGMYLESPEDVEMAKAG